MPNKREYGDAERTTVQPLRSVDTRDEAAIPLGKNDTTEGTVSRLPGYIAASLPSALLGPLDQEPRPDWSVNPATPCSRNRRTHLYTKRRLIPTVAAMSEIDMPSATSKMIRPRRARPAGIVVARCHARRVWRTAGVRRIAREVLRPRAILIPHRQENMDPVSPCQRGQPLSQTVKDTTCVFEKSTYM